MPPSETEEILSDICALDTKPQMPSSMTEDEIQELSVRMRGKAPDPLQPAEEDRFKLELL